MAGLVLRNYTRTSCGRSMQLSRRSFQTRLDQLEKGDSNMLRNVKLILPVILLALFVSSLPVVLAARHLSDHGTCAIRSI